MLYYRIAANVVIGYAFYGRARSVAWNIQLVQGYQ
jgi:hypothetical protein